MLRFVIQPPLALGLLYWILVCVVFHPTIWQCLGSTKLLLVRWTSTEEDVFGLEKRAYCMVKWNRVCRSKSKGGLGVKDLAKQNISLLSKWWWKLQNHEGLWQKIVTKKIFEK
jgi:hypothetical protein